MEYDVIVIGSGSSGMSCAAALALEGKTVLVLEQSQTIGGYFGSLAHERWVWDLGCQYATASMFPDNRDYDSIAALTGGEVGFTQLDEAFQRLYFPDFEYTLYSNKNKMMAQLVRDFPHEKQAIEEYYQAIESIARVFPNVLTPKRYSALVATLLVPFYLFRLVPYMNKTLEDELEKRFGDDRLKAILSAFWSSAGLPPGEVPFLAYAVPQRLVTDGVFYPNGGSQRIIDALQETIESRRGSVMTGRRVARILFERKKAIGVGTTTGERFTANVIVSGIGIKETINTLLPAGLFPARLKRRINSYAQSFSALELRLGFRGDISPYVRAGQTYRVFSDTPFDLHGDPTQQGWRPANALLVFSSLCDQHYPHPNYPTAEIIVFTPYRFFEKYEDRQSQEYGQVKERITATLIEKVLLRVLPPDIENHLKYTQLSTPISIERQTLHIEGAAYGMALTSKRLMDMHLLPTSPLRNLYFTGADVFAHGIIQTMIGGILTASAITGKDLLKQFAGR